MAMAMVQFDVDNSIMQAATKIYDELGLDLASALRLFLKKSVDVKGFPFPVVKQYNYFKAENEMTSDELDAILVKSLGQAENGQTQLMEDAFVDIRKQFGYGYKVSNHSN